MAVFIHRYITELLQVYIITDILYFVTEENSSDELAMCLVSKQIMIHQLPPVLILHMKRFEIGHANVTKDSRYVSFPEILDMAPYCTVRCLEVIHTYVYNV